MNKKQLGRLLIVIASIAAVVFVPYWVGDKFELFNESRSDQGPTILIWWVGSLMLAFAGVVVFILLIILSTLIERVINYIKHG